MAGSGDTILRFDPDEGVPYYQMARETAQDKRLSWEAWGVLSYLHSLPRDWQLRVKHLVDLRPGGRDRMYRIIRELRDVGYIVYRQERVDGRVQPGEYIVRMRPLPGNQETDSTSQDAASSQVTPLTDSPDTVEAHHTDKTVEDRRESDRQTTQSDGDFRPPSNVRELKAASRSLQAMKDGASRAYLRYVERLGHKPEGARTSKPWHDELLKLFQAGHPVDRIDAALDACRETPWNLPEQASILKGQADHPRTVPQRPEYLPMPRREDQDVPDTPEHRARVAANLERVHRKAYARARKTQAAGRDLDERDQLALAYGIERGWDREDA
jgi:hypothetical protein